MNEFYAAVPHKDRSTGLAIFGVLTIGLGCLSALFIPLLLVVRAFSPAQSAALPASHLIPAMVVYAALAVALIWAGIGSIMARRWARALLLIFSWTWLVVGVLGMVVIMLVMPSVMGRMPTPSSGENTAVPQAAVFVGMIIGMGIDAFFLVLMPGVWVFFYSSRHVKATCEARQPNPSWTDACPLPVLAIVVLTLLSIPSMMLMPLTGHPVLPFFGIFLTGGVAAVLCYVLAAFYTYIAAYLYRLDVRGWWLLLLAMIGFNISVVVTYARNDMGELYRLMGYPQAQIDQITQTGIVTGPRMAIGMGIFGLLFIGYILFIKRYFKPESRLPR